MRHLLYTGFLAFILIGILQAMYGPAFSALRARYGLSAETVAGIVSFHFLGSFIAISLSGFLIRLLGYRRLLSGFSLLMLLGSLGVALSENWTVTLAAAFLAGLGYGAVDIGTNLLFARAFEARSAPALNLLNAMFGVGAMLGPLVVTLFLPSVRLPFLAVAVLTGLLFFLCLRLSDPPPPPPGLRTLALPYARLFGFALIYFLYVASEVGVASWETTHLAPYFGVETAAGFTALFWGAITLGRFIAAPLSSRVGAADLVLGSTALAFGGILLTFFVPIAPYAYVLVGFALAPIFPTGIGWLQGAFPKRAEQIVPIVAAVANLGPVAGSWFIGAVVERSSSDAVPTVLSGLVLLLLVVTALVWRWTPSTVTGTVGFDAKAAD